MDNTTPTLLLREQVLSAYAEQPARYKKQHHVLNGTMLYPCARSMMLLVTGECVRAHHVFIRPNTCYTLVWSYHEMAHHIENLRRLVWDHVYHARIKESFFIIPLESCKTRDLLTMRALQTLSVAPSAYATCANLVKTIQQYADEINYIP